MFDDVDSCWFYIIIKCAWIWCGSSVWIWSLDAFYLTVPLALTEFPRARQRLHWHCFLSETQGLWPRAPRNWHLTSDNPEICSMHPFDFWRPSTFCRCPVHYRGKTWKRLKHTKAGKNTKQAWTSEQQWGVAAYFICWNSLVLPFFACTFMLIASWVTCCAPFKGWITWRGCHSSKSYVMTHDST